MDIQQSTAIIGGRIVENTQAVKREADFEKWLLQTSPERLAKFLISKKPDQIPDLLIAIGKSLKKIS